MTTTATSIVYLPPWCRVTFLSNDLVLVETEDRDLTPWEAEELDTLVDALKNKTVLIGTYPIKSSVWTKVKRWFTKG